MTKELQDLTWSCLPKEFKEEVKELYDGCIKMMDIRPSASQIYVNKLSTLEGIFGIHNLTSDAEGEEMLMVPRKKVQDFFMNFKREKSDAKSTFDKVSLGARMSMLQELFGSKCLPDTSSVASNVASPSQNSPENCDSEPHISIDCDKPAEPKFKYNVGDEVKSKLDGEVHKIAFIDKWPTELPYKLDNGVWVVESDLEPYTFPTAKNLKESAKTFASDEPTTTESGNFDRIVNDGFRNHNRLHVAAMAMQGILSHKEATQYAINNYRCSDGTLNRYLGVAESSLAYADALIAECERTDKLKGE